MRQRKVPPSARYRDFTVLLARQRSGTNALRSVLGTHPGIHCFYEVLHEELCHSKFDTLRAQSYFHWLVHEAGDDVERFMPGQQEAQFTAFLDHLRTLTPCPVKVIDVKYNMVHLLSPTYQALGTYALFELITERRLRVLNLVRRNYLRPYLSRLRAAITGDHGVRADAVVEEPTVRVKVRDLARKLEQFRREDLLVERAFGSYRGYLKCEYSELFTPEGTADPVALERIASWLGVEPTFDLVPKTKKLTALPLWEAIENWDEVQAALRPTRFAYCLDDEPSYVARAGGGSDPAAGA